MGGCTYGFWSEEDGLVVMAAGLGFLMGVWGFSGMQGVALGLPDMTTE